MSGPRKTDRLRPWPSDLDDTLMSLVAEGWSFERIARVLSLSRNAVIGRFHRLRQAMGWQAS